jgi:hypothetical protein
MAVANTLAYYGSIKFYSTGPRVRIQNTSFCKLQIGLISLSVTLHKAGKACQGQTLKLIGAHS